MRKLTYVTSSPFHTSSSSTSFSLHPFFFPFLRFISSFTSLSQSFSFHSFTSSFSWYYSFFFSLSLSFPLLLSIALSPPPFHSSSPFLSSSFPLFVLCPFKLLLLLTLQHLLSSICVFLLLFPILHLRLLLPAHFPLFHILLFPPLLLPFLLFLLLLSLPLSSFLLFLPPFPTLSLFSFHFLLFFAYIHT